MKRICLFTAWIFLNTVVKSGAQINPGYSGIESGFHSFTTEISPKGIDLINIKGRHWALGNRAALPALLHKGYNSSNVNLGPYFGRPIGMRLTGTARIADYEKDMHRLQNSIAFRPNNNSAPDDDAGIDIPLGKNTWLNLALGYYDGLADAVKDPLESYDAGQDANMNISLLFAIR